MPEENSPFGPFVELMRQVVEHGAKKYGASIYQPESKRGIRNHACVNATHAADHFNAYLVGEKHDHFGTLGHQLAAVAVNAMNEFYFFMKEEGE